jgi:hypothetical protein
MSRWEYRFLGCEKFPDALSALEIEQFFTFESVELTEVKRRRGAMNRLAMALQIGFVKMTGAPLNSVQLIPVEILDHLGRQLGVGVGTPRIASVRALYRRRRTLFDHQQAALDFLGFRYLSEQAEPTLVAFLAGKQPVRSKLTRSSQAPVSGCSNIAVSYRRCAG